MNRDRIIADLANELKFKKFPVSIDEFIHDPYYLGSKFMIGNKCLIYDIWVQRLREVFPDPITTTTFIVSKGGIGTGKSTFSIIVLLYDLYKLLCLEYPELVFERAVGTGFAFKFFNVDLPKAKIFVNELWDIIKSTPFFLDEFRDPNSTIHRVSITPASRKNHLLSEDVLTLIMSEVNYIQPERRAKELIDAAVARVRSRFRWAAGMFSHIIFDTSDEYINSPMEIWLKEDGFAKIAKVYQTSQWEAKPNEFFKNGHFWVYAGDSTIPPKIIDENEVNDIRYDNGRIIKVPNELRIEYESDIDKAIKDSAGVALFDNSVFFDAESIAKTLVLDSQIKDEVVIDFYDDSRIIDLPGIRESVKSLPSDRHLFCRIDLGVVNDNCGIAFGYVERFFIDKETGSKNAFYNIPIAFAISRKPGQETSIDKIRDFILEVHYNTPLYSVSTDQFQSRHLRQLLEFEGLNTKEISVDRNSLPYSHAKVLFKGGYVKLPRNKILEKELAELKRVGLKVDHPKSGSKDIADAVVGLIDDIFQEGDKVLNVPSVNTKYHLENQFKITQHLREQRMKKMQIMPDRFNIKRGNEW